MVPEAQTAEAAKLSRFEFGANWSRFAERLEPERIDEARASLDAMLGSASLLGASFLDIGSGSGLFSLAATQLGAARVHSFDFDPESVATTEQIRARYAPDSDWIVESGDVLARDYLESLGLWDVVYSWGVLHHTGDMWKALDNACSRVRPGGRLFVALYNDQGAKSRVWRAVKRLYQALPAQLRTPYVLVAGGPLELRSLLGHARRGELGRYLASWKPDAPYSARGMNRWHDLVDWIGGYPFEWAAPDAVFAYCRERGFELERLVTVGGSHGCNEFVFRRATEA
jgi:2-polyprenyl-3-methyl-5-hydroxy-6-metoxy-1,4-benzoquinol methylase